MFKWRFCDDFITDNSLISNYSNRRFYIVVQFIDRCIQLIYFPHYTISNVLLYNEWMDKHYLITWMWDWAIRAKIDLWTIFGMPPSIALPSYCPSPHFGFHKWINPRRSNRAEMLYHWFLIAYIRYMGVWALRWCGTVCDTYCPLCVNVVRVCECMWILRNPCP